MSAVPEIGSAARTGAVLGELAKLPAFVRRDFLDAWSYRASFLTDIAGMLVQVVTFYFVGKMINRGVLPTFSGHQPTYVEFVVVGIALNVFVTIGLHHVASALQHEQWKGTLESLLMTPTALATLQLGSVIYDLVYIPIRTIIFVVLVAVTLGLNLHYDGLLPAGVIVLFFIPFIWGLGLMSGGAVLTFKGANIGTAAVTTLLTLGSGAYFPLQLFPDWVEKIAKANPLAIAIQGTREALIGGSGWSGVAGDVAILLPASAVSLLLGVFAFRLALARERRRGSLPLY
jgi:ABC-2 type transport system permease protein